MEHLKNLTTKRWIVPAMLILMMYVSWQLAFSKSWNAYKLSRNLNNQILEAKQVTQRVEQIKSDMNKLNTRLESLSIQQSEFQGKLLNEISSYCKDHEITVTAFPESIMETRDEFMIQTIYFSAQGKFHELLKLTYLLEQEKRIGRMVSVDFFYNKDRRTGLRNLRVTMYLQLVTKVDNMNIEVSS